MLQYATDIHRTIKGLGAIADNQSGTIRLIMDNWPIAMVAGVAISGRLMQRHKKKELSAYNVMIDVGAILTPIVALMTLSKLGREREEHKALQAALPPALPSSGMQPMPMVGPS